MKNVVIFGCPRAGKTTIAIKLNEELKYSIISIDSMITGFQKAFPRLNIRHGSNINQKAKKVAPFLYEYLKKANWEYTDRNFVLEGWHNLPNYFMPMINREEFVIVCLGYPNANEEELFKKIRENDTQHDNTIDVTDEYLRGLIHRSKEASQMLQKQCQTWNIPFFETDNNRKETLEQVLNYIKEKIQQ